MYLCGSKKMMSVKSVNSKSQYTTEFNILCLKAINVKMVLFYTVELSIIISMTFLGLLSNDNVVDT